MVLEFNQKIDPIGKKILQTKAIGFEEMTPEYESLIADMKDTADNKKDTCVGISSNQLWKNEDNPPPAIFIANLTAIGGWRMFMNPKIKGSGPKITRKERCMSMRGERIKKRDKNITVTYFDFHDDKVKTEKYTGMDSRIIQHEMDHLNGKLI